MMRYRMIPVILALQMTAGLSVRAADADEGQGLFEDNCAVCHGAEAAGTDKGPPLVHRLYVPGHHGDESFQVAVALGSRQHHWRFGDMPPVEGVSPDQVAKIVAYVRKVQREAGIE